MARNELPEWVNAIILIVILMVIFPVAAKMIFDTILFGIFIGVIAVIIIFAINVIFYIKVVITL